MPRFIGVAVISVLICIAAHSTFANPHVEPAAGPSVIVLNDTNWRLTLKDEWLLKFHAPWCPACRSLVSSWNEFAANAKEIGISVGQVDVTEAPGLSGRFFVTALPTIFHVKDGVFRQYRGPRDPKSLRAMIEQRKWGTLQEISAWKHPDSIQMTVISHFFTLSHYLKDMNDHLQEEYNCPVWLSYALFAIVTIFLGAVIGLIFVCIVDVLIPPRHLGRRKTFAELQTDPCFEDYPNEDFEVMDPEEVSTSEDEKYSGTDSDDDAAEPEGEAKQSDEEEKSDAPKNGAAQTKKKNSNTKKPEGAKNAPRDTPEVRKRNKSRKAD